MEVGAYGANFLSVLLPAMGGQSFEQEFVTTQHLTPKEYLAIHQKQLKFHLVVNSSVQHARFSREPLEQSLNVSKEVMVILFVM